MKKIVFLLSIFLGKLSQALPEAQIQGAWQNGLFENFLKTKVLEEKFKGKDGVLLNYYFIKGKTSDRAIIFSPGQTESSLKYVELMMDLQDFGGDVYFIDHRNQGKSERVLPHKNRVHVRSFGDYVEDFELFYNKVILPQSYTSVSLWGHSMGGAIASGFGVAHPEIDFKLVLFSPMLKIKTFNMAEILSLRLVRLLNNLGLGENFAPGQSEYDFDLPFESNTLTTSQARYENFKTMYKLNPDLAVGGSTAKWVEESIEFTRRLRQRSSFGGRSVLIFQSGQDEFVRNEGSSAICAKSHPKCTEYLIPNGKHELLQEVDQVRTQVLLRAKEFSRQDY